MKIKLSKIQWQEIGNKSGWLKAAQRMLPEDGIADGGERYTPEELSLMDFEQSKQKLIAKLKSVGLSPVMSPDGKSVMVTIEGSDIPHLTNKIPRNYPH